MKYLIANSGLDEVGIARSTCPEQVSRLQAAFNTIFVSWYQESSNDHLNRRSLSTMKCTTFYDLIQGNGKCVRKEKSQIYILYYVECSQMMILQYMRIKINLQEIMMNSGDTHSYLIFFTVRPSLVLWGERRSREPQRYHFRYTITLSPSNNEQSQSPWSIQPLGVCQCIKVPFERQDDLSQIQKM